MSKGKINIQVLEPQQTNGIRVINTIGNQFTQDKKNQTTMATIDNHLEWQITEAKKLISELPDKDRENVEAYIKNIRDCLERERKQNTEYQEWFNKMNQFVNR